MSEIRAPQNSPSYSQNKTDKDQYYKRLQKSTDHSIEIQKRDAEAQLQKQSDAQKTASQNKIEKTDKLHTQDQSTITKMRWTQTPDGSFVLDPHLKEVNPSSVDIRNNGKEILKYASQKVDMQGKVPELKETYMQNIVQSRSHNFFLARYAAFKVGMIGQLLSVMGVAQEELQKMQKKALEGAKDENITQMSDNMYNLILTELIHGNNRKSHKTLAMFQEAERQLIIQMDRLGFKDHWNPIKLYEERIRQAKKIKEEFVKEKGTLHYHYLYLLQENQR
jgi:hypothetical protein